MTRRTALALLSTAVLLLASWPLVAASPVRAAPEQVYLALGDSIAAGLVTSLPRMRGYPWLVRDLIERLNQGNGQPAAVTLVDLAVPGETAESFLNGDQLRRARDEIAAAKARGAELRAVTITLGGNDLLNLAGASQAQRQAGLDRFKQSYPAVLSAVKAALGGATPTIVVTTYYDLSEGDPSQQGSDAWWVAQFNQVIRQSAAAAGAKVADLESAFRGRIRDWTWYPTDVHPNNAGHAEIAKLVWQALGFDDQLPKVSIERPAAGALERRTPTVRVKATDNVGVTQVQLLADGKPAGDLMYVPSQDAYIGVWDGRYETAKSLTLAVQASDLAGHVSKAEVTVSVPGQPG